MSTPPWHKLGYGVYASTFGQDAFDQQFHPSFECFQFELHHRVLNADVVEFDDLSVKELLKALDSAAHAREEVRCSR